MMPASAIIDSEDDDDDEPAGSVSRRVSSRGGREKKGAGLAAIDITTPLEEDEVMPEVKPYVVSWRGWW